MRRWHGQHNSLGAQLRETSVSVLSTADLSAQYWMRSPAAGEWPSPITGAGGSRKCADPGCEKGERRAVMIVRGVTQIACRTSDLDNAELFWLPHDCRVADYLRTPHAKRESVKTAVCRMARGSPQRDKSVD